MKSADDLEKLEAFGKNTSVYDLLSFVQVAKVSLKIAAMDEANKSDVDFIKLQSLMHYYDSLNEVVRGIRVATEEMFESTKEN